MEQFSNNIPQLTLTDYIKKYFENNDNSIITNNGYTKFSNVQYNFNETINVEIFKNRENYIFINCIKSKKQDDGSVDLPKSVDINFVPFNAGNSIEGLQNYVKDYMMLSSNYKDLQLAVFKNFVILYHALHTIKKEDTYNDLTVLTNEIGKVFVSELMTNIKTKTSSSETSSSETSLSEDGIDIMFTDIFGNFGIIKGLLDSIITAKLKESGANQELDANQELLNKLSTKLHDLESQLTVLGHSLEGNRQDNQEGGNKLNQKPKPKTFKSKPVRITKHKKKNTKKRIRTTRKNM
jgi:hypothetical protein